MRWPALIFGWLLPGDERALVLRELDDLGSRRSGPGRRSGGADSPPLTLPQKTRPPFSNARQPSACRCSRASLRRAMGVLRGGQPTRLNAPFPGR